MKTKRLIAGVATLATAALLAGCSSDGYTDQSMQSLRYEAGATQGGKFVECMEPGQKIATNDKVYPYPVSQREDVWDSDNYHQGSFSADHPDLVLTDKDGNDVHYKLKVPFFLNTSCAPKTIDGKRYPGGTLQAYHELIGKTRHAYFSKDGTYGGEKSGWIWAMNNYISGPVTNIMNGLTRSTTVDAVWLKQESLNAVRDSLQERIQQAVNESTETDLEFYRIGEIQINQAVPAQEYVKLFQDRRRAQINADTAEANRQARIQEAKADTDVAQERAKVLQAEIRGAGGPQWYWCGQALERGKDCFVPGGQILINRNQ